MRVGLSTKVTSFFAILAVVVVGNFIFFFYENGKADTQSRWVAQTFQVLEVSEQYLSSLRAVEAGQRGFLLTQENAHLEPYELGRERAWRLLGQLKELTNDNPAQRSRLDQIEQIMVQKLNELAQTVQLVQDNNLPAALQIVRETSNERFMDRIGDLVSTFQNEERRVLREKTEAYKGERVFLVTVFAIEGIALVVMMGVLIFLLRRTLVSPLESLTKDAEVVGGGGYLEREPPDFANDEVGALAKAIYRMNAELKTRSTRLEKLSKLEHAYSEILSVCTVARSLDTALGDVLRIHAKNTGSPANAVFVFDARTDRLKLVKSFGASEDLPEDFSATHGLLGEAFQMGQPLCLDATDEPGFSIDVGIDKLRPKAIYIQPIAGGGETLGVMFSAFITAIDEPTKNYLQDLGDQLGSTIINFRQVDWLKELANELDKSRAAAMAERDQAVEASISDPLTGVRNRGYFDVELGRQLSMAKRYENEVSIALIDIDHFKKVNDTFGHQVGDEVIIAVCDAVNEITRESDVLARYGGEEFVIILPNTPPEYGIEIAEKVRDHISTLVIPSLNGKRITASLGVASFPANAEDAKELVSVADQALYQAKNEGRNRVCVAGQTAPSIAVTSV